VLIRLSGNRTALTVLALSLTLSLAACSKDDKKPATQVAAKVNAEEISVHQINFVLARSGANAAAPEQVPAIRREILDKLIDQQLAVEQALEKKLDRSPDVVMAIEAARREILARAYIEQVTSALAKPSVDEAKKYYSEHPQLFAERRVYNIQEIQLPASAGVGSQLRDMVNAGKPLEEIAVWLKSKDIKFAGGSATRPAEQIPLDLLPQVHALKDGQGLVIDGPQNTTVMRVVASQAAPIPEAVAIPRVQQFLGNQLAGEAATTELKQLKAKAKITYQGEFADATGNVSTPAVTAPAVSAPKANAIEKGAAGLK